jgi:D-alanyl-D-alanine carboxypeptidase
MHAVIGVSPLFIRRFFGERAMRHEIAAWAGIMRARSAERQSFDARISAEARFALFIAAPDALGRSRPARRAAWALGSQRMGFFARGAVRAALGLGLIAGPQAMAAPTLVVDMDSGQVLHQEEATRSWYPASLTKLMTAYVALKAARDGRLGLNTPLRVSARAAKMAPSKMGFKPGTEVTLDNALKMLMVKSANDVAVTIAEGVAGSVEAFAGEMNRAAASLGMRESHFVNPNGLPSEAQVTSARDMAVLGRALYREFPEQAGLFSIGALKLGNRVMPTHNGLLGRYPGADGMKTGFTCSAGFNVVASAANGGRRLITVVMGAPSAADRTIQAMALFDKGFASGGGQGSLSGLPSSGVGGAPNMREEICKRRGKSVAMPVESEDMSVPLNANIAQDMAHNPERAFLFAQVGGGSPAGGVSSGSGGAPRLGPRPYFEPVPVFIGRAPGYEGAPTAVAAARRGKPAAAAYAAQKPTPIEEAQSPIAADASAQPLRGRTRAAARPLKPAMAAAADADEQPRARAKARSQPKAGKATKPARKVAAKARPKAKAKPAGNE